MTQTSSARMVRDATTEGSYSNTNGSKSKHSPFVTTTVAKPMERNG